MEKKNELIILNGVDRLSEEEKLELFKVEELETRLEMAALQGYSGGGGNGSCNGVPITVNGACPVGGNGVCTAANGVCW